MNTYEIGFGFKKHTVVTPAFKDKIGKDITKLTGSKTDVRSLYNFSFCVHDTSFTAKELKDFLLACFSSWNFTISVQKTEPQTT